MEERILYEDNHLIAVNKLSSEIVQGDITGDEPLSEMVRSLVKRKYNKPGNVFMGVPHRLDRPTSGLVLFAKTSKALSRLNDLFRNKEVQKVYWAVVKNCPQSPSGTLVDYLVRNPAKNKSFVAQKDKPGAKYSELDYQVLARSDRYYLLEIRPKTGRHHQIRVQLSNQGWPIKGDLKYGFPRSNKGGSIHLHARRVEFIHPVKKEPVVIEAPVPQESLWQALSQSLD
ncbi:RNA pseudouridine synthase [bacterium SCSIO 12741]|nr:RNA pseudouridine synthase [bacterium SCSIO 12741]